MEVDAENSDTIEQIIKHLVLNKNIYFKNQSRDEADLTDDEKTKIATNLYEKSKISFLIRFGKFFQPEHLSFFKNISDDSEINEEIDSILTTLTRFHSEEARKLKTKNRRYEALKKLISEESYFSETEMMRRNPLLYDQLIGRYLSEAERRERDKRDYDSLVKILMERVEKDITEDKLQKQKDEEDEEESEIKEDEDMEEKCEGVDKAFRWGEFSSNSGDNATPSTSKGARKKKTKTKTKEDIFITTEERQLLRDEFISIMYHNFLDGKDDYDYSTIDDNDEYDDIKILEHDEEDKYFDSEEPDEVKMDETVNNSSEDELDIYMNALNQHPTVVKLSEDLEQL